jgi:hypothetical protein
MRNYPHQSTRNIIYRKPWYEQQRYEIAFWLLLLAVSFGFTVWAILGAV